jgi:hypothetical protein
MIRRRDVIKLPTGAILAAPHIALAQHERTSDLFQRPI